MAVTKSSCCCCAVTFTQPRQLGWGSPCSPCPAPGTQNIYSNISTISTLSMMVTAPGTPDYELLCPHGSGFSHAGEDINECSTAPSGDQVTWTIHAALILSTLSTLSITACRQYL